jgi:hypothetical protein
MSGCATSWAYERRYTRVERRSDTGSPNTSSTLVAWSADTSPCATRADAGPSLRPEAAPERQRLGSVGRSAAPEQETDNCPRQQQHDAYRGEARSVRGCHRRILGTPVVHHSSGFDRTPECPMQCALASRPAADGRRLRVPLWPRPGAGASHPALPPSPASASPCGDMSSRAARSRPCAAWYRRWPSEVG